MDAQTLHDTLRAFVADLLLGSNPGGFGSARQVAEGPPGLTSRPLTVSKTGPGAAGDRLGISFTPPEADGSHTVQKLGMTVDAQSLAYDEAGLLRDVALVVRLLQRGHDVGLFRVVPTADGGLIVGQATDTLDGEMLLLRTATAGRRAIELHSATPSQTVGLDLTWSSVGTDGERHPIARIVVGKEQSWTSDPDTQHGYLSLRTLCDGVLVERLRLTSQGVQCAEITALQAQVADLEARVAALESP